jgi:hypothetical protein
MKTSIKKLNFVKHLASVLNKYKVELLLLGINLGFLNVVSMIKTVHLLERKIFVGWVIHP